jgi:YidC/Oxa1 family membrane protein insertase
MMMVMPVVMLFIFYSMPSALVLYWSTSQCLAIVQLLWQRRRPAAEDGAGKPATPPAPEASPRALGGKKRRRRK